jgi:hypothetical protein
MTQQRHWERIYRTRGASGVSWYQPEARGQRLGELHRQVDLDPDPGGATEVEQSFLGRLLLSRAFLAVGETDQAELEERTARAAMARIEGKP